MAGREITEGRGSATANIGRSIAVDLGIVSSTSVWQNTTESYDVAVGGLPFFYAIADDRPYIRQTAPFNKQQSDISAEPGEQSLTGWWLRSQSSFHNGTGIKFYDPSAGETVTYRFADSQNVDVWTKGQATLLKESSNTITSTGIYKLISGVSTATITNLAIASGTVTVTTSAAHGLSVGQVVTFSNTVSPFTDVTGTATILTVPLTTTFTVLIGSSTVSTAATSGTVSFDVAIAFIPGSTTIKNIGGNGSTITTYATTASGIIDVVTNGTTLFVANATRIFYQTIGATGALNNHYSTGNAKVKMGWVKQRLVAGIGTAIYELTGALGTTTLPTPVYTHPNSGWEWTSISEGGTAIYAAGYAGGNSAIYRFSLSEANGGMPTLTSGIIAAQLPIGEIVYKIETYLGYMLIGTNKGVRVATVESDGSLSYGPLVIEESNGVYDFAFRDRFVWITGAVASQPGLYRIDLGAEITTSAESLYRQTLRFAYATDTFLTGVGGYATSVDFIGNSDQIAFTTSASNGIAIQSTTVLATTGYIKTGKIRFGTLEPKNFKRLIAKGSFTVGETLLSSVATNAGGTEIEYDHIGYSANVNPVEVTTNQPETAQEFLAYKFTLSRETDATISNYTTLGPTLKGYQAKATIATPRRRVIKFPAYCFDIETDRFNTVIGYEGRAFDRIKLLEQIEQSGDVLTWQDLTTGESQQAVIEEVTFTRMTPPDRRFDGFGGILQITVRTV